jgi:serine phosphatase RsbU (regulator of sigma subunit)
MRQINEAFYRQNEDFAQYATAVVLSHDCRTGELIFASAGHPPTLWYHASQKSDHPRNERRVVGTGTSEQQVIDRGG